MRKKDIFSDVKKKVDVLEPRFKEQVSEILDNIGNSLSALYDVATRDEKTGVYNHRFFRNVLDLEIEKAKRKKEKLCLIVVDVDFFKKVNDKFGHLVGDKILKELAKNLESQLRKYDVLSRFGGEEFFVMLPETSIQKAKKIAERLRKNLWKNKVLKKYEITISLGVTEFKQRDSVDKMVHRADKALYKSKDCGRNCVNVV